MLSRARDLLGERTAAPAAEDSAPLFLECSPENPLNAELANYAAQGKLQQRLHEQRVRVLTALDEALVERANRTPIDLQHTSKRRTSSLASTVRPPASG